MKSKLLTVVEKPNEPGVEKMEEPEINQDTVIELFRGSVVSKYKRKYIEIL